MDIRGLSEHIDKRMDRLEDKLDDHLGRISKAEASIEWLKGHVKITTTLFVTTLTSALGALYHYVTKVP